MSSVKKIGILETGRPPEALQEKYGLYPDMFKNLLRPAAEEFEFHTYSVMNGDIPVSPEECDGWIITGSPHGVYEELPWMLKTEEFLRCIVEKEIPLIGVCFGHQIMAKALGGTVEKSSKGWGLGFLDYRITERLEWMVPSLEKITISATHQDQVVSVPPSGKIIATSDFCPHAMIAYGKNAFSIQAHPEMLGD